MLKAAPTGVVIKSGPLHTCGSLPLAPLQTQDGWGLSWMPLVKPDVLSWGQPPPTQSLQG